MDGIVDELKDANLQYSTSNAFVSLAKGFSREESSPQLSKNALKKLAIAKEKELKKQEAQALLEKEREANKCPDCSLGNYGKLPIIQSTSRTNRQWTELSELGSTFENQLVMVRGRLHNSRGRGKQVFIVLRERFDTIQAFASVQEGVISKELVKFAMGIPKESVIDIEGTLQRVSDPIQSCSVTNYEIHIQKIFVISEPTHRLPMSIEDASRPEEEEPSDPSEPTHNRVNLDTRLDNRIIDLRTITNMAIFKISHGINAIFREYFLKHGFLEIHSPKMIEAASEGGASVFKIGYFKRDAFLAQSPQFAKQMAICADFGRVFEFTPVFRAENSFTHRHLTEYTGVDMEMAFHEHYHEVMDKLGELFLYLFDELKIRYANEIEIVRRQFPAQELQYPRKLLVLKYSEGIQLLRETGIEIGDCDDINTTQEKLLGRLVKEKYGTDFFAMDKFPISVRPFYTMMDPVDPRFSNSYDYYMRGEEIMSGAQRIHDYDLLCKRAAEHNIEVSTIQSYLDAFKYGVPPHAGGGIGLERVVMFYLGLGNIRRASLFPRDPKRLSP